MEQLWKALKKQEKSNKSSDQTTVQSSITTEEQAAQQANWSLLAPQLASTSIQNQSTTVPTIAPIEQTLANLQQQRRQLEVTISVLSHQLHLLKQTKNDEDCE